MLSIRNMTECPGSEGPRQRLWQVERPGWKVFWVNALSGMQKRHGKVVRRKARRPSAVESAWQAMSQNAQVEVQREERKSRNGSR